MSAVEAARRLVEQRSSHPVVSLYLDLDPERFATAPARASQIRSLIDGAAREIEHDTSLAREDRLALREDLHRIERYLLSREPPFKGARSLALFCSSPENLFEVVRMPYPVAGRVIIERTPYVEPLVRADERCWCVALVSRRVARVLTGTVDSLGERARIEDNIHGQHDQGGWSQANYERSIEEDAANHLRRAADVVNRRWRRERFERIALGGPHELVPRFVSLLADEVRERLADGRVDVDVATAGEDEIRAAVGHLVEEEELRRERAALDRLAAGIGAGGRACGGLEPTLAALAERRVETLLLEVGFDRRGGRCPRCRLLSAEVAGNCPADGTELEELEHLREAAVEAALAQDAEVIVVRRYPDLGPFQGIGSLLRF